MDNKIITDQEIEKNSADINMESDQSEKVQSKAEMARQIARNISVSRRAGFDFEDETDNPEDSVKKNVKQNKPKLSRDDFVAVDPAVVAAKEKSKKKRFILILILILFLSFFTTFYLYGMSQTKGKFLPNTTLNGTDIGGNTPQEVYDKIVSSGSMGFSSKIDIIKRDGSTVSISMEKLGYKDNISGLITDCYNSQNHYLWFASLISGESLEIKPEYSFDDKELEGQIRRRIIDTSLNDLPKDAGIERKDNGFVVIKETQGGRFDTSKESELLEYIKNKISDGESKIDLSSLDVYQKPKVTSSDLEETCKKLNSLKDIKITFNFNYTKQVLKGEDVVDWIAFDDTSDKKFKVDADKAMKYVEELADKYDTYGKDRIFKSTSRGTITVKQGKGCYGWWIDQEKTCNALVAAVEKCESADLDPIYYVNPDSSYEYTCNEEWRTAKTDMGNTYMEVDLKKQHFWYYENGKLKYQCDIVSGYPNESRNTPEGVYKLWLKEKGKTLTGSADGESYSSYVDFWNNVSTIGIGLHDASWQNGSFGGTKYKSSTWGSHGCINMPYEAAEYVFKNVPIGTPCVMYW